jgi:polysaccharide biosynthesis protein PslH
MPPNPTPTHRRTLFLSYLYPSFYGSGTQIRAAALVRMLAAREDVYLLVINQHATLPGPPDKEMESLCCKCQYLQFQQASDRPETQHTPAIQVDTAEIPRRVCPIGTVAAEIKRFYDEEGLNHLFVFRIESYFLMEGSLDLFPSRYLDMDESSFRRNQQINSLMAKNGRAEEAPERHRANTVLRILEKQIIPRFSKVFTSSENELKQAQAINENVGFYALPNIYPFRVYPPHTLNASAIAQDPRAILFVGTLSYYPNEDAVRYFAAEILPLIQRKYGESILFRIVGFGCPASLKELEKLPGVRLMGYQESLDSFYTAASLVVVPLRAGTGTRLKIQEAFTRQRPVVSTSIGAEGLKVTDGENILLADEPEAFAEACLKILAQPELASRLVQGGVDLHRESYSLDYLINSYDEAVHPDLALSPHE